MQVQIRSENVFTLLINGRVYNNMRQESAWEDFIKLKSEDGEVILHANTGFSRKALDSVFDVRTIDLLLIKASPSLLAQDNKNDLNKNIEAEKEKFGTNNQINGQA
jgi:hypothetical protein